MTAGETMGAGGPLGDLGREQVCMCMYVRTHTCTQPHIRIHIYVYVYTQTHIPTNRPSSCSDRGDRMLQQLHLYSGTRFGDPQHH